MSKQQIFVKHKDQIILEIIRLQRLTFCDDQLEAEAVNHGKIQGLMWAAGLYRPSNGWLDVSDENSKDSFDQWNDLDEVPVVTGDRDTDALLEDERIAQEQNQADSNIYVCFILYISTTTQRPPIF